MSGAAPEDDDGNAASGPREQHRPAPRQNNEQRETETPGPAPTLADRADDVEASLKAQTSPDALAKTWARASKLCADLDVKDPERLAVLQKVFDTLRDEMDANPFAREAA